MALSAAEIRRRLNPSRFSHTPEGDTLHADINHSKLAGHTNIYEDGHTNEIAVVMPNLAWNLLSTRTAWALSLLLLVAIGRVYAEFGLNTAEVHSLQPSSFLAASSTPPIARDQEHLYHVVQGLKDFALAENGATIACPFTSACKTHADVYSHYGSPSLSITDSLRAGDCWNTHSHSAELGVLLSQHIRPRYFSLDHALQHSHGLHRAPRNITVWGVIDGVENRRTLEARVNNSHDIPSLASSRMVVPVANMYYSIDVPITTQTFPVFDYIRDSKADFSLFIFQIIDNWGAASTCLYRVRIYGEPTHVRTWFTAVWK
ncbi:hypothetical protein BC629DRAFT_1709550 [Irpex lacteus]|nr:hypothetical protein BC629DRAFT_1709550 [Irpex lacteus]